MEISDDTPLLACHEKLVFPTRREAQAAATVAGYRYGSKLIPYRCHGCGMWHLTSTPSE